MNEQSKITLTNGKERLTFECLTDTITISVDSKDFNFLISNSNKELTSSLSHLLNGDITLTSDEDYSKLNISLLEQGILFKLDSQIITISKYNENIDLLYKIIEEISNNNGEIYSHKISDTISFEEVKLTLKR